MYVVCLSQVPATAPAAAAGNPMMMGGMMDGMKGQIVFMVSQLLMYQWISTFFSGFLLRMCACAALAGMLLMSLGGPCAVRVPFPLTMRFKDMLQQGIYIRWVNRGSAVLGAFLLYLLSLLCPRAADST